MLVSVIDDRLRRTLSGDELKRAEEATGRHCLEGQRAVAELLIAAKEAGKFPEAMGVLGECWEYWKRQHPVHRGDPDFAGNGACYAMAYLRLGLDPPNV